MIDLSPWWECYPGRLEYELKELQAVGVAVVEDMEARQEGVIRWNLTVPDEFTGRGELQLIATFPEFYPLTRPEVEAPGLTMGHHQHPFGKTLCLIGRSSQEWGTNKSLAWLITAQLHTALNLGESGAGGVNEEDQGEPFSDYYTYSHFGVVLIDSDWSIPEHPAGGEATFRVVGGPVPVQEGAHTILMATTLSGTDSATVAEMPEEIRRAYPAHMEVQGRWSTVEQPISSNDPEVIWAAAEAADTKPCAGNAKAGDVQPRLIAFPEEHSRTSTGTGWMLVIKEVGGWLKPTKADLRSGDRRKHAPRYVESTYQLVRAGRVGHTDFRARNAHLSGLNNKRVLLIGAGALGSVISEQLARAGLGALTVIDRDILEAGNLARHAATIAHVGMPKSLAVHQLVASTSPYTDVKPIGLNIGSVAQAVDQRRLMTEEYMTADLVIDASAEVGVQRITADLARGAGTPWVMAEGTNGAWGGTVVRVAPGTPWCFSCFEWHRVEGSIPFPPVEQAPLTQPIGCAEPTFTGAAHDLDEIAMQAVRTAVAVLLNKPSFDVANVTLHDPVGPTLPRWTTYPVTKHPDCVHQ